MTIDKLHPGAWLREEIAALVRTSPLNRLGRIDDTPIFGEPLVGVADGDDPLFAQYKEIIGPFHLLPREALGIASGPVRVVSWILPIVARTRESNRERVEAPSRRWAHTKQYGEALNDALRDHVVGLLREAGHLAAAPGRTGVVSVYREEAVRPPSADWSERHAAYAAGLGTFGLSDGLITPRGIAHRCGSVVTDLALEPTPRPYAHHTAYCRYLSAGACGDCMARCPAGAITPEGHDKARCAEYIGRVFGDLHRDEYGVTSLTCGLCQTGVPCEGGIPQAT